MEILTLMTNLLVSTQGFDWLWRKWRLVNIKHFSSPTLIVTVPAASTLTWLLSITMMVFVIWSNARSRSSRRECLLLRCNYNPPRLWMFRWPPLAFCGSFIWVPSIAASWIAFEILFMWYFCKEYTGVIKNLQLAVIWAALSMEHSDSVNMLTFLTSIL